MDGQSGDLAGPGAMPSNAIKSGGVDFLPASDHVLKQPEIVVNPTTQPKLTAKLNHFLVHSLFSSDRPASEQAPSLALDIMEESTKVSNQLNPKLDMLKPGSLSKGLTRLDSCPGDLKSLGDEEGTQQLQSSLTKNSSFTDLLSVPQITKSRSSSDLQSLGAGSAKPMNKALKVTLGLGDSLGSTGSGPNSRTPSPTSRDISVSAPTSPALKPRFLTSFVSRMPQYQSFETITESMDDFTQRHAPQKKAPPPAPTMRKVKIKNRDINSWAPNSL